MRAAPAFMLVVLLVGCGPLAIPMVQRLGPADQKQVDTMWTNLLTPPDRIDEQTLLDCLIVYQLHHLGVDELHARSVKHTPAGKVIMTIDFDRDRPAYDRFTVKVVSRWGWTIREHRWTSNEVMQSLQDLFGQSKLKGQATTQPSEELQRRWDRIAAATQPASS